MTSEYFKKLYLESDIMINDPWKKVEDDLPIHTDPVLARINDPKEEEPFYAIVRFLPRMGWVDLNSTPYDFIEVYYWMEIPR